MYAGALNFPFKIDRASSFQQKRNGQIRKSITAELKARRVDRVPVNYLLNYYTQISFQRF